MLNARIVGAALCLLAAVSTHTPSNPYHQDSWQTAQMDDGGGDDGEGGGGDGGGGGDSGGGDGGGGP